MNVSLAQYFAAHAPSEVPEWFYNPIIIQPPKSPKHPSEFGIIGREDLERAIGWIKDPCFDLEEMVAPANRLAAKKFVEAWTLYRNARVEHSDENQRNRFFEWRIFYGREMARRFRETKNNEPGEENAKG